DRPGERSPQGLILTDEPGRPRGVARAVFLSPGLVLSCVAVASTAPWDLGNLAPLSDAASDCRVRHPDPPGPGAGPGNLARRPPPLRLPRRGESSGDTDHVGSLGDVVAL